MRNIALFLGVIVGLAALGVILGLAAGEAGASVAVGVIFGVAAAVPTALAIALVDRGRRQQVHHHDQRQVIIYFQHADGRLERLNEEQVRRIAAPASVVNVTR